MLRSGSTSRAVGRIRRWGYGATLLAVLSSSGCLYKPVPLLEAVYPTTVRLEVEVPPEYGDSLSLSWAGQVLTPAETPLNLVRIESEQQAEDDFEGPRPAPGTTYTHEFDEAAELEAGLWRFEILIRGGQKAVIVVCDLILPFSESYAAPVVVGVRVTEAGCTAFQWLVASAVATTFSNDRFGEPPGDWTEAWGADGDWSVGPGGPLGGRQLEGDPAVAGRRLFTWDAATTGFEEWEMLTKVQVHNATMPVPVAFAGSAGGTFGTTTGLLVLLSNGTQWGLRRLDGGALTDLGTQSLAYAVDTWLWVRLGASIVMDPGASNCGEGEWEITASVRADGQSAGSGVTACQVPVPGPLDFGIMTEGDAGTFADFVSVSRPGTRNSLALPILEITCPDQSEPRFQCL